MSVMHPILRPFRRFLRDDCASVTVEVVMILPLLIWGYMGMFVLFDGYKALSSNIRVGYTISDLLSRETNAVTPDYIEGLNDIQDVLTQSEERTVLRVTVVSYDADNDDHDLKWSYSTDGMEAIVAAELDTAIIPYLPPMPHGGQLVVVETWMAFVPIINMTLEQLYGDPDSERVVFGPFYFENLVTIRPRFAGQLIFDNS